MTIEDLNKRLGCNSFLKLNIPLMHSLGNDEAIVYSTLAQYYEYYKKSGSLTDDGYFFCTVETLEDKCNVSKDKQKRILSDLQKRGLIERTQRGLPKRRYIKVLTGAEVSRTVDKLLEYHPDRPPKIPMPEEVREKYSKPFNPIVLQNQIKTAVEKLKLDDSWIRAGAKLYEIYFREIGYPPSFYSQSSIEKLMQRASDLDFRYSLTDNFSLYCEEYARIPEKEGYNKSINNLVTEEMLEPIALRLGLTVVPF